VTAAVLWGTLAVSSLVLGALLGLARERHEGLIGVVLEFGARVDLEHATLRRSVSGRAGDSVRLWDVASRRQVGAPLTRMTSSRWRSAPMASHGQTEQWLAVVPIRA
jgi:hypothetical protein